MRQAPVAQMAEQLICNQRVAGSMPARGSSNRVPWGYKHPARPARKQASALGCGPREAKGYAEGH